MTNRGNGVQIATMKPASEDRAGAAMAVGESRVAGRVRTRTLRWLPTGDKDALNGPGGQRLQGQTRQRDASQRQLVGRPTEDDPAKAGIQIVRTETENPHEP